MASIINTGISALNAFKRQMETTGHNIANVNTEGYSRQRVDLATRPPQVSSQGFVGSGIDVTDIRRSYDNYLALRVRDYTASYEEFSVYEQRARQIDNVIADSSAGIDGIMQQFFAAVNDVADDPTSIEARSMVLNRASQLSDRFNALDSWFSDIRNRLNQDLQREANEINAIAQSLVEVNARIGSLNGLPEGIPPDILDERDKLIDELSHYTNVSAVPQGDGTMSVFIGTGQALVVGVSRNNLVVTRNPQAEDQAELAIQQPGGGVVTVTRQMAGGTLGGLLRFRDEVLDESHNALGRVAIGLASAFNEEHRTGMDLDGDLGNDLFAISAQPQVLGDDNNVTAAFTDIGDLTTHEYQLRYDGSNWSLTDLTNGGNVPVSVAVSGTTATITASGSAIGFSMSVADTTAVSAGDTYRIRPTRLGANDIDVLITNERDIAAAEPLVASNFRNTAVPGNPLNTGTGSISLGQLETVTGSSPSGLPITIQYNANVLSVSDSGGNALGSFAYVPGSNSGDAYTVTVAGLGTYGFTMTGDPDNGDTFVINANTGGTGDNRNARSLADLQNANLMIGGTATLANTYGTLVADVGTRAQQAQNNAAIQQNLLSQAEAAKSEVSGVNLDEEAADLVRFQQAYQAAAQVISIANSLFDTLLGAVRR